MMTTNNAVNNGLSGTTGTGNFVGTTSPTLITPTLGVATATSIAFSPTTGGIIGTTAADNAGSGYVGQFVSSVIAFASGVTFTNNVSGNVTSISLTAGDWLVWGNVQASAGTTTSGIACGTNTVSATVQDGSQIVDYNGLSTAGTIGTVAPFAQYNISSTMTVYLVAAITGTGTLKLSGGIYARRIR